MTDKSQPDIEKGRKLNRKEIGELREGQGVYEMTQTPGWQTVKGWLEDRAFHSWVDPRETKSKKEWEWQELNAFHSADVSSQLLIDIQRAVERSEYLDKVKKGEIKERRMRI